MSVGAPFSHVYLRPSAPTKDSQRFRNRLAAYVLSHSDFALDKLVTMLSLNMGAKEIHAVDPAIKRIATLFKGGDLRDILDAITYIADYLIICERADGYRRGATDRWRDFITRLFEEESVGYMLDEEFGVRYKVDMDFEQVRVASIAHLGISRYKAVLDEFEKAYRAIESTPPDTKVAVRSMFEAVETLFRLLLEGKVRRLGSSEVERHVIPIVRSLYGGDGVAANLTASLCKGLAEWANGLQAYRHGQPVEEPSPPPLEAAVAVLQTGSAYIRLLVELDRMLLDHASS